MPSVRRLDVFKALFGFSSQLFLSAITFPILPDATKYAMGVLKHSLHSCFFCYHQRTTTLEDEVAFFNRRLGASRALVELLSLRRRYRRSFSFVIPFQPTHPRLHQRRFVLVPLCDLDPGRVHPRMGVTMGALLAACPDTSRVVPFAAASGAAR